MKRILFILPLAILTIITITFQAFAEYQEYNRKEIADEFLGGMSSSLFIAMCLWAYIGMFINMLIDVGRRDVKSEHSPKHFSFSYWWKSNGRRLLLSIILVPVTVVTFTEMFGMDISVLRAIGIGLGADYLVEVLKRRTVFFKEK